LSTAHIGTGVVLEIAEGGQYVRLGQTKRGEWEGGGKRGEVGEFTRASRQRLMRELAKINRQAAGLPGFLTLTYPQEWPRDGRVVKGHLKALREALRRRWPSSWGLWRLEYQPKREDHAPHFHLLLWGIEDNLKGCRGWLAATWYRIVGSGDEKHLRAGTGWDQVRGWGGAAYLAKRYLGKVGEEGSGVPDDVTNCGRFWGKVQARLWPVSLVESEIPPGSFAKVRRVLRRWVENRTGRKFKTWRGRGQGLTVFLGEAAGLRLAVWAKEGVP
jgi:hypothetical protein